MSVFDAVLAALVAFLILVVLGTLRELAFLRNELAELANARDRSKPSAGNALPEPLSTTFGGRLLTTAGVLHHLVFLGTGCGTCTTYGDRLSELVASRQVDPRDVTVIASVNGSGQLVQRLRSAGVTVVPDEGRQLTTAATVTQTPTTIAVEAQGGIVRAVWVGKGADVLVPPPVPRAGPGG